MSSTAYRALRTPSAFCLPRDPVRAAVERAARSALDRSASASSAGAPGTGRRGRRRSAVTRAARERDRGDQGQCFTQNWCPGAARRAR